MTTKETAAKKAAKEEAVFSKEALINSKKYFSKRDLLSAVLEEGKFYTIKEAEERIKKYLKGKVN